ncbi:MFS general substrate transporter [Terfezia boudieri ATCC MYA-4762]|uniref:MFS general substrate transporter n=1 Tax=Terfezia boudieri ATCC MYA-4762 TaxID=1051890 RepID=A0A3N4LEM2_9PEZI|nr:MFS general substrate transporter [Terfezia boudieri ATCC MYA-4762]
MSGIVADKKRVYEHHDASSTEGSGLASRFEGAPAGWDPETAHWDSKIEKRIMRRVDWKLLPMLIAMYMVALIDRTNMPNALITGMGKELHFVGDRYSIALMVFFIPYLLFELPSNILLRKVGAAKWLGSIVICWGLVMIGMGFTKHWWEIAILRTMLGFFEAGFFPGSIYLISCWYVRYEVQQRLAIFYLLTSLASGFAPLLASGLMQMGGQANFLGWRWIFIMEGILTVLVGCAAYVFIIDFPDKVINTKHQFLTKAEVEIIKFRIDKDRKDSEVDEIAWSTVIKHLRDWKLWVYALLLMCAAMPAYAFALFLSIILKEGMGYSTLMSQLLSTPPVFFSVIVALPLAWYADKTRLRAPFMAFQTITTIVGLSLTGYAINNGVRYFGAFLGIAGAAANIPAGLAYQSNNIRTNSKRCVASALQIGFASIGGMIASMVFRLQDAPRYIPGIWVAIGCQFLSLVLITIMSIFFMSENRKQKEEGKVLESCEGFRYTY